MNCYNFVIEFEHNGQFGHEEHQLTLKEGERFVGFAMVVVSERDERETTLNLSKLRTRAVSSCNKRTFTGIHGNMCS